MAVARKASKPTSRATRTPATDAPTEYAQAVLAGEIPAGELIKAACRRHLKDLKDGPKRGLAWRPDSAAYAIGFFEKYLKHSKGEWAGKPVILGLWQKFIIGSVFGWKRADGSRRFRYIYEEVPRKNGKSLKLAGIGLFGLVCDLEDGAEIYSAATKKDQAKIIFDEAKRMVAKSPDLAAKIRRYKSNLSVDATFSKFEPLSADENTLDGLNPHFVLADELHKHRTRALFDVLDTAVGARRQPLIWIITTAGDDNPESVYANENEYATKILEGVIEDDGVFAFIATIDKDDKWDDPAAWAKANPNLNVSVKLADLERQARKASKSPSALSAFKRLRLNVRSAAAERAIDMPEWALNSAGKFDPADMLGRRCWAGLDLSSKIDISAYVKIFEPLEPGGRYPVVCRFWMPGDTLEKRSERDKVQYRRWVDEGWIETTVGNVIDHSEIGTAVLKDMDHYDVQSVAYDSWNATQLAVSLLGDGVPMVEFVQGSRSYAAPTADFEALVAAHRIEHGLNPVLAWMMSNLKFTRDKNENKMPNKHHSTGRIDGASSLIMAIGRMNAADEAPGYSIFEDPALWSKPDVAT
ncbi:terminase large subunit [Reyranella sp.]|uniref:terminase large subunit n=1 Tax=Reyranella sp. TaxID=1929291 RepID=UPI0027309828|nr:terminase TerL endonuclease subunit [Reyranella sp.]MDP2377774.1 terminase large subunit [Reyranella sp.]